MIQFPLNINRFNIENLIFKKSMLSVISSLSLRNYHYEKIRLEDFLTPFKVKIKNQKMIIIKSSLNFKIKNIKSIIF